MTEHATPLREADAPPDTISQLFERCFAALVSTNKALADINVAPASENLTHKEEAAAQVEHADKLLGQIRTRLRGCWIDPATDEENVEGAARGAAGAIPPALTTQLGRIIPATSRILIDVSLQAAPLLAARTPRAHIEVETSGMDPDEVQKVTEVARDAAEDTAEFFKPRVTVSSEREGADKS